MADSESTTDRILRSLKNNRVLAGVLVLALLVIGLGTLTEAIDKIIGFAAKYGLPAASTGETISAAPLPSKVPLAPQPQRPDAQDSKKSPSPKASRPLQPSGGESAKAQSSSPKSTQTAKVSPITPDSRPQESRASTPSQQVSPPESVRTSVRAVALALQGQTMSHRQASIAAALSSLPDDLSGPEIALLLADETMSSRSVILQLLTERTKKKSLDPRNVAAILAAEDMSTRESMTAMLAPLIKSPIAASLLDEILGPATDCTRTRCLRHLAPLVERPIPERDVEAILRSISGSCRSQAISFLFSGGA